MKLYTSINEFKKSLKAKPINEGKFSWFTQDTEQQIGSDKENKIVVYMYDNAGNIWKEADYQGYGEFGGKDYYDLMAEMNGYTIEDANEMGKELRNIGIDLTFNKIDTKNEDGKKLFPALVSDSNYDIEFHDFTTKPEDDPNQGWDEEEDEHCPICDSDDYDSHTDYCYNCDANEEEEEEEEDYSENKINEDGGITAFPVEVYRSPLGDSTNRGLSSKKTKLMLAYDVNSPFKTKEGEDYLVLKSKRKAGSGDKMFYAVPKSILDSGKHHMFGGNFVYTSDSRFPTDSPIKIFDRVE